jgi:hypothetical protein
MTLQESANFLWSLDTGFRYIPRLYYAGGEYGKPGAYEGNAVNQIGIGEGYAALGASRVQMLSGILLHKTSEYLSGSIARPWSAGTLQWARIGYDFYPTDQ